MSDELTEEQEAAAKLEKESKEEKSTIAVISEQLSSVEDMLKSQVEKDEVPEEPTEKEIDFETIKADPAGFAKSFVDDPEGQKDFIKNFSDACGIHPRDMYDEDGTQLVDDEMMKALEESEEKGEKILTSIFHAIQETNNRSSVKDNVIMQTISQLTKGISGMNGVMEEMKKSLDPAEKETEKEPGKDLELPNLDEDGVDPLSKEMSKSTSPDTATFSKALKKSFNINNRPSDEEQAQYHRYADKVGKASVDTILALMKPNERETVQAELSLMN